MRHCHPVIVEQRGDDGRAHAGILRLALRRAEDGQIGLLHIVAQQHHAQLFASVVQIFRARILQMMPHLAGQHRNRNTARHFAGIIAAHAVRQHHQSEYPHRK